MLSQRRALPPLNSTVPLPPAKREGISRPGCRGRAQGERTEWPSDIFWSLTPDNAAPQTPATPQRREANPTNVSFRDRADLEEDGSRARRDLRRPSPASLFVTTERRPLRRAGRAPGYTDATRVRALVCSARRAATAARRRRWRRGGDGPRPSHVRTATDRTIRAAPPAACLATC